MNCFIFFSFTQKSHFSLSNYVQIAKVVRDPHKETASLVSPYSHTKLPVNSLNGDDDDDADDQIYVCL